MKIYVSDGTWFDKDTIAVLVTDFRYDKSVPMDSGLFYGTRTCIKPKAEAKPLGVKYIDGEVCSFDEFEVMEIG